MNKIYVVSGYFAECATGKLHEGHIDYIKSALDLCEGNDFVLVVINNEGQQILKYGRPITNIKNIKKIILETFPNEHIAVKYAVSQDRTVCKDLEHIKAFFSNKDIYFVKDTPEYNLKNLPESEVSDINFIFLNNEKVASASEILSIKKVENNN